MNPAPGRNDPCPCGSGKKFKHCHGNPASQPAAGVAQVLPLLAQAQQLLVQGEYQQASELLRRVLRNDPANPDAQHFLGMATGLAGNPDEGIKLINRSLASQPSNPLFRYNLAFWLGKTGNIGAATRELLHALMLKPDYHEARYQLVKLVMERKMYALARLHIDVLLSVEPENPELRYRLATILLRLKEHTAMEREFRTLIARAPGNVELHMKLGEGLQATGRDDARCLNFYESGRVTRTASYVQVSQPLYRTSQERWRHYRKHLEPVIPTLTPFIEKLGYSL